VSRVGLQLPQTWENGLEMLLLEARLRNSKIRFDRSRRGAPSEHRRGAILLRVRDGKVKTINQIAKQLDMDPKNARRKLRLIKKVFDALPKKNINQSWKFKDALLPTVEKLLALDGDRFGARADAEPSHRRHS
jgi:DNA-binding CsgD family transcriptional regulator